MGLDAAGAHVGHEIPSVIALVGTEGILVRTTKRTGHSQCGFALGLACDLAGFVDHPQAVAVLHESQECSDAWGFLEWLGLSVACAAVGLIGKQEAVEIPLVTFIVAA
jgi:hypothetical protein